MTQAPPGRVRATLDIDLGAIAANYRRLRAKAPSATMAAVVKADAYGLGAAVISQVLHAEGCTTFFVSRLEEGLDLRSALPDVEIMVLDGLTGTRPHEFQEASLIPVLNHEGDLERWSEEAWRTEQRLPAVLHFDTGMNRLGLQLRKAGSIKRLSSLLDVRLVMSHLACTDRPQSANNVQQLQRFSAIVREIQGVRASLANSGAIFLGEDYHFDLCRPGIALFGGNPIPSRPSDLDPVISLRAPVLSVWTAAESGTTGYGATRAVRAGTCLATIGLGYADGLMRAASNRASLDIEGYDVPIVGRISMDLTTLDITSLPSALVNEGDLVAVIHGPAGIDRFAAAAGTIPYEVLTRLGTRLKRRYMPAP